MLLDSHREQIETSNQLGKNHAHCFHDSHDGHGHSLDSSTPLIWNDLLLSSAGFCSILDHLCLYSYQNQHFHFTSFSWGVDLFIRKILIASSFYFHHFRLCFEVDLPQMNWLWLKFSSECASRAVPTGLCFIVWRPFVYYPTFQDKIPLRFTFVRLYKMFISSLYEISQ